MPYTLNGIGTWYYGKRRIHTLRGTCEFCGQFADMSSYDTTHYFVVLYIPLIPLGQYRILNDCTSCRKHRAMKLKEWEQSKAEAINALSQELRQNVDDPEAVQHAIGVAVAYQDEGLLLRVADRLASGLANNADVQRSLGSAFAFFSRTEEAAEAFRASLTAREDLDVRCMLAVELMRQGQSDEPERLLRPVMESRDADRIGYLLLLAESHQVQANHSRALELLDFCAELNPQWAGTKEYRTLRKRAEKLARSGKSAKPVTLAPSKTSGYREGGVGSKIARWLGPAVAAAAVIAGLAIAYHQGRNRTVFLVSGVTQPYAVSVNGQTYELMPGSVRQLKIAEGSVEVSAADARLKLEPATLQLATPFLTRPFVQRTFVINPDRLAIMQWQETGYGPRAAEFEPKSEFRNGELLYEFREIDYPFQDFPREISVSSRSRLVRKTRLTTLSPNEYEAQDLYLIALSVLGVENGTQYLVKLFDYAPNDEALLGLTWQLIDRNRFVELTKPHLTHRPVLVHLHRAYQTTVEEVDPERDLAAEYRTLHQAEPNDAELLYLLGRVTPDIAERQRMFRQAAEANPPSAFANMAIAFYEMGRGEFEQAQPYADTAYRLQPQSLGLSWARNACWLALGRFDDLLKYYRARQALPGYTFPDVLQEVQILGLKGDRADGDLRIRRYHAEQLARYSGEDRASIEMETASLRAMLAYASGDADGFVKEWKSANRGSPDFDTSFTAGELDTAAQVLEERPQDRWQRHLLLYLAREKAGDREKANESFNAAIERMKQGDRDLRQLAQVLAANEAPDLELLHAVATRPEEKRIVLAALGLRFPAEQAEYFELGRKLNFDPAVPRLFLNELFGQ